LAAIVWRKFVDKRLKNYRRSTLTEVLPSKHPPEDLLQLWRAALAWRTDKRKISEAQEFRHINFITVSVVLNWNFFPQRSLYVPTCDW
jgi:hypothetical protein